MNEPSAFQAQYPLSPKKFWKKMINTIPTALFYCIFLSLPIVLLSSIRYLDKIDGIGGNGSFINIPQIVITFLVVTFIYTFIYALYVRAYIRRYYYDCADQFITIKKGVFAPTEIHVQYQKIQDVYVDQDIYDRVMGLYDVHIASATVTSGIEAHIDGVNADVAESLKNIILNKIQNNGSNPTQAQNPVSAVPVPPSKPVQFSQKISSETYPINGKWIWSALFSAFFASISISFFMLIIFTRVIFDSSTTDYRAYYWFLLLIPVIFIGKFIASSIWKSNFYFEFMPDYILLRTGIISRQENHLPYKSIQNVLNKQSIIDRILGLSTVVIQNAAQEMVASSRGQAIVQGSGISLVWQPKAKAEELNNILNEIVSKITPQNSSTMMGV